MEGVGARLGRSSTRYGPATVFSGPVRKWKKRWIHVSPSNGNSNNNNNSNHSNQNHNSSSNVNGSTTNGNNGSHLLLYKWTPLSQRDNNGNSNNNSDGGEKNSVKDDTTPEEPPRRKFKYIPIAVIEEQKRAAENEAAENADNEAKTTDIDPSAPEPAPRNDGFDEKPDINDIPVEENQDEEKIVRQDLNESLDLSLGLKAHEGDSDSKADQT